MSWEHHPFSIFSVYLGEVVESTAVQTQAADITLLHAQTLEMHQEAPPACLVLGAGE